MSTRQAERDSSLPAVAQNDRMNRSFTCIYDAGAYGEEIASSPFPALFRGPSLPPDGGLRRDAARSTSISLRSVSAQGGDCCTPRGWCRGECKSNTDESGGGGPGPVYLVA